MSQTNFLRPTSWTTEGILENQVPELNTSCPHLAQPGKPGPSRASDAAQGHSGDLGSHYGVCVCLICTSQAAGKPRPAGVSSLCRSGCSLSAQAAGPHLPTFSGSIKAEQETEPVPPSISSTPPRRGSRWLVDESMSIFHPLLPKFLKFMKTPTRLIADFTTRLISLLHFLNKLPRVGIPVQEIQI